MSLNDAALQYVQRIFARFEGLIDILWVVITGNRTSPCLMGKQSEIYD